MIPALIATFGNTPKRLFLVDGFGALLSAFLLGVILTRWESYFGMPRQALYFLALLPCLFAIYDFSIYFRNPKNWAPYLKAIAIANWCYCLISIAFLFHHRTQLTYLGWAYFLLELVIVIFIASLEFKTAAHLNSQ